MIMNNSKLKQLVKNRLLLAVVVILVAATALVIGLNRYSYNRHVADVKSQLEAEESSEEQFKAVDPSAADNYVSDFKYVSNVTVTSKGFSPANVIVKPQTKVIVTGGDDVSHFMALAPGSTSPKYFDPKIDLTQNSVFQMKFETTGTYSFYDRYNPIATMVVVVSDK
jgi:plastocyanin